jgi:cardiolipin synthase
VLESYIFRSDETGQRFATALVDAVSRGVAVRVLTDWIGMRGIRSSFVANLRKGRCRRAGVQFARACAHGSGSSRAITASCSSSTAGRDHRRRRHRRRVDRQDARHRGHWRDTAVRIEGPPRATCRPRSRRCGSAPRSRSAAARTGSRGAVARGAHLDPATAEPALVGIVEGEPLRMRVARALQMQSISAERSIWIANAYFVPNWAEVEALLGAARDGVDVRILVPQRNDHPWVTLLTRRYYRRLLTNGVRIWEYKGAMMHAKTSVVDGRWVRVGSTDFNPLGVAINYELDAVIEDPALGAQAEAMFLADLEKSKEITMRSRVVGS